MDKDLLRRCKNETFYDEEAAPCTKNIRLKAEDEISLDSVFSYLLSRVEPSELTFQRYRFKVPAKDLVSEKAALIFNEKLYISKLRDNCKLEEELRFFLEDELIEIGQFKLNIEESYDGYVVFSSSKMKKDEDSLECGHLVRAKYDDHLKLICEKRTEFDFIDNTKIEKSLELRIREDKLLCKRLISINRESQRFKAVMNMKGRDDVFVCDAGILLLMRYLIVTKYQGDFYYFTMNIFGKILRCHMKIHEERKCFKIFHRTFKNVIWIVNTQYFNNYTSEVSETFYTPKGRMILHFWRGFNYVIHETKGVVKRTDCVIPKMEIMWRSHESYLSKFHLRKELNYKNAIDFFGKHPELYDFLHDFLLCIIKLKPACVLDFTVKYFRKYH